MLVEDLSKGCHCVHTSGSTAFSQPHGVRPSKLTIDPEHGRAIVPSEDRIMGLALRVFFTAMMITVAIAVSLRSLALIQHPSLVVCKAAEAFPITVFARLPYIHTPNMPSSHP